MIGSYGGGLFLDNYMRISYRLRKLMNVVILINLLINHRTNVTLLSVLIVSFTMIIINDYLRHKGSYFQRGKRFHIISLGFSILAGSILVYFARGYTNIYLWMLIIDILFSTSGTLTKVLLSVQVLLIYTIAILRSLTFGAFSISGYLQENGILILIDTISIASFILLWLSIKSQMIEKAKVKKLNIELQDSYKKLKEYSEQVEELTVSKERQRVAQEIHDSLGHSLTAIIMHLDYIEKIFYTDSDRAHEIIIKIQDLSRNSMEQVRKAVYTLKESDPLLEEVIPSIEEMIKTIAINDNISVGCDIDNRVEELSMNIKRTLFKTIQEGITNGINHGEANKFTIEAYIKEDTFIIKVSDNGKGCDTIHKGNGVLGMEQRVNLLSGVMELDSDLGEGFTIRISIPLGEEIYVQDKVNAC